MDTYDSIVIGAGHNGLVCGAYLARAGQRVLIIEAEDTPGGLAGLREFHPGFSAAPAHRVSHLSARVASDLGIPAADPAPADTVTAIGAEGQHVVCARGGVSGVGPEDEAAFVRLQTLLGRFAGALEPLWHRTMPGLGDNTAGELLTFARLGFDLRRLGREDLGEFTRMAMLPVRDLVDEYFEDPLLKALVSFDALLGSKAAPRTPNVAPLAMLYRLSQAACPPPGGVRGLVDALVLAAQKQGAEVRCGAAVERIVLNDAHEAVGVVLEGGEQLAAARIVSATDPKMTFERLVGVANLEIGFANRIRRLRAQGYVAKLHLALTDVPEVAADLNGRLLLAPDVEAIELAFDAAKYGELSERPVMEVVLPSLADADLAPAGAHVLSAQVMYVPYTLRHGWTESARASLYQSCLQTLEASLPGVQSLTIAGELLTPVDLEARYRVSGGHWHHGELAIDQMFMMRPTYEAAQHSTPIAGLYLCSAGCHPGGDLTGMAGHNAAREILA